MTEPKSFKNRDLIQADTKCGCYHCLRIFKGESIVEWLDEQQTAVCPFCSIDSVVVKDDGVSLTELQKRWFS